MRTAVGLAEPDGREEELARLRELLWMRLALGAYRDREVAEHVIAETRRAGSALARDGYRVQRRKGADSRWGSYVRQIGRALQKFADAVEGEWRPNR